MALVLLTNSNPGDAYWGVASGGLTYWSENNAGDLYPNTTLTQDFGLNNYAVDTVYTLNLILNTSNLSLNLTYTNQLVFGYVGSTGSNTIVLHSSTSALGSDVSTNNSTMVVLSQDNHSVNATSSASLLVALNGLASNTIDIYTSYGNLIMSPDSGNAYFSNVKGSVIMGGGGVTHAAIEGSVVATEDYLGSSYISGKGNLILAYGSVYVDALTEGCLINAVTADQASSITISNAIGSFISLRARDNASITVQGHSILAVGYASNPTTYINEDVSAWMNGIHILGNGPPATYVNGMIWSYNGSVYAYSGNAIRDLYNIP